MDDKKKFYESEIALSYQVRKDINAETFLRNSQKSKDNSIKNSNRLKNYGNFTPGRGFGNLQNNNFVRFGENTRKDKKEFNKNLERNINYRFDYLFDDKKQQAFTKNNLKMNENTRKQQIRSDSIFDHQKFDFDEKKRIENEYYKMLNGEQKPVQKNPKPVQKKQKPDQNKGIKKFNFSY